MVLNLEQLSNENLVNFYKKELKMIDLGEPARSFFSQHKMRGLIEKGILRKTREHARARTWLITLTDMTRTLIY